MLRTLFYPPKCGKRKNHPPPPPIKFLNKFYIQQNGSQIGVRPFYELPNGITQWGSLTQKSSKSKSASFHLLFISQTTYSFPKANVLASNILQTFPFYICCSFVVLGGWCLLVPFFPLPYSFFYVWMKFVSEPPMKSFINRVNGAL